MVDDQIHCDVATVTAVNIKFVTVEIKRSGGCKSCSVSSLCFGKDKTISWDIETDMDLNIGDKVELLIAPQSRILASLLVFLVPILALLGGYYLTLTWLGESYAVVGGFGLLLLSFVFIWLLDKRIGKQFTASIGRKL